MGGGIGYVTLTGLSVYLVGTSDPARPDDHREGAVARLRTMGACVRMPSPLDGDLNMIAEAAADLEALLTSDLLVLMPGAREANVPEIVVAEFAGIPCVDLEDILQAA